MTDPSGLDDDTPDGFDPESVIERWAEIEEHGHPIPDNEHE
jgi:hypothetical protein